jgi:hypothetical protein
MMSVSGILNDELKSIWQEAAASLTRYCTDIILN